MHGYQHVFHKISKSQSIIPYYDRSEFSGLSLEIQKNKIKQSLNIFLSNKVNPTVWVAPAHSFDAVTLKAISEMVKVPIIASGGAGNIQHFCDTFVKGKADAALAASVFHYKEIEIKTLKSELKNQGINVRL